jgi:hypothetical protein
VFCFLPVLALTCTSPESCILLCTHDLTMTMVPLCVEKAAEDVRTAIMDVNPRIVFLELDKERPSHEQNAA